MKSRQKLLVATASGVAGVFAVAFLLAGMLSDRAWAQDGPKAAVRWEYCCLESNFGRPSFINAKEVQQAKDWKELAAALKVPGADKLSEQSSRLAIFDFLGNDGWEMVSHTVTTYQNGRVVAEWSFKRRLK